MKELLESCEGNPLTAALCGYIFEPYAIEMLGKGGDFKCRKLVSGHTITKPDETTLNITPSGILTVKDVEHGQHPKQLYKPINKNYTAIDAWIPEVGAFQITVGKTHPINPKIKNDLPMLGLGGNKLYWLLPPLYYHAFTKKPPHDIDQYAVQIPYPIVKGYIIE